MSIVGIHSRVDDRVDHAVADGEEVAGEVEDGQLIWWNGGREESVCRGDGVQQNLEISQLVSLEV